MARNGNKRVRGTRRDDLISALISLLDEGRLFSDILVEDITKRAEMGRPAFYAHFKTKEDVLIEALQTRYQLDIRQVLERFLTYEGDDFETLGRETMTAIVAAREKVARLDRAAMEAGAWSEAVWNNRLEFNEAMRAILVRRWSAAREHLGLPEPAIPVERTIRHLMWMNERSYYMAARQGYTHEQWCEMRDTIIFIWNQALIR